MKGATVKNTMLGSTAATLAFLLASVLASASAAQEPVQDQRPNILLIVADDLGFADLGVHGSNIRTPNIDALAAKGIIFSRFHTAPLCAPTRAMLLSGNNNHVAGMARQHPDGLVMEHLPGYEGHLSERIAPLPRLLRDAGYQTYTAGKWHLGTEQSNSAQAAGFERSFNLVDGAGNHWDAAGFENRASIYRSDGVLADYPDGEYSTAVYTDRLINFIDKGKENGKPFFVFAAYTSPHWPLQVPGDELDRYQGVYDQGYDILREKNFTALKSAGIIPASSELPPRNDDITRWRDLSAQEQKVEARKMELYAAMVENLDGHIGRLLDYLKASGLYENTLLVFMSDNGAAAEDFYDHEEYRDYIQARYDNRYENMGQPDSWVSYGPQWAEAGSAPFKRYKGHVYEGGIAAPMIVAGAGVKVPAGINSSYVTLMDLAPTFLELAGAEYPADGSVAPMLGESMLALLAGQSTVVHAEDYVTTLSHRGRSFIRKGQWKLVHDRRPFDEGGFELYDLQSDPGESNNLAEKFPEKREELVALWREKRTELGIVLPQDL
jgi:arylsulfatase